VSVMDVSTPGEWALVRVWGTQRPMFEPIERRGDRWLLGRETLDDDDRMSRRHCEVRLGAGGWVIEDLGSANGTHVNGAGWVGRRPGGPWQVLQIGRSLVIPVSVVAGVPLRMHCDEDAIVGPGLYRCWEAVGDAAAGGAHVVLAGPPGCGFTMLARHHERVRGRAGSFTVHELDRRKPLAVTVPPGVALVTGGGSLERYAMHPWIRAALRRHDLRLVLALECDPDDGTLKLPEPLSRFRVITVPGLDVRPEEIPWRIAAAVQAHAPTTAVDVTFPEACLLRRWGNGIPGLLAETRDAIGRARQRDPDQALLQARDLSEYAGLPTDQAAIGGLAPPSGPRWPAAQLADGTTVMQAVVAAGGDLRVAAARLGVPQATLEKWLRHHKTRP